MKKGPGPKMPPALKEQQGELIKKGLTNAAKVIVPMVGATVAMFKRKPEERLEAKGMRQEKRAARKMSRAEKMQETSPKRAAKLSTKAASLKVKGAANRKAAEGIAMSKKMK